MNLEWIAIYRYDTAGRLIEETFYDSQETWGELYLHFYDDQGLRNKSERWDLDKSHLSSTETVSRLNRGELSGWTIRDRNVAYEVLYEDGSSYAHTCIPASPMNRFPQLGPNRNPATMRLQRLDAREVPVQEDLWVRGATGPSEVLHFYKTTLWV
jgi:hypothetical protein